MPRISELPNNGDLTGYELVPIVQDGQTRHAMISELLVSPRVASLNNARWVTSNYGGGLINNQAVIISLSNSGGS